MSHASVKGAICYEAESSFAEDVTTFSTLRIPTIIPVDVSGLKHEKIQSMRTTQRLQEDTEWILGTMTGSTFKIKLDLTGHGTATTGSTSAGGVETLLGYVFGNVAASASAGTTATGGTANIPTTTASGTFSAGSLPRFGTIGDARGNGQFVAVSSHSTTNMTLLTNLDAAPNNADVIYDSVMVYPYEDPTAAALTGLRFLLQTANYEYECHGCVPTAVSFSDLSQGKVPTLEITFEVAWWRYSTATFPSATSTETYQAAANAGGSFFMNDVGTATRSLRSVREVTLDYKLGVERAYGVGGVSPYQTLLGAYRTPSEITLSFIEDAGSASTSPTLPGKATATTPQHVLYTWNPTALKAMCMYIPNYRATVVPIQMNHQGINRLKYVGRCCTGGTTTNDLTASAIRFGFS